MLDDDLARLEALDIKHYPGFESIGTWLLSISVTVERKQGASGSQS